MYKIIMWYVTGKIVVKIKKSSKVAKQDASPIILVAWPQDVLLTCCLVKVKRRTVNLQLRYPVRTNRPPSRLQTTLWQCRVLSRGGDADKVAMEGESFRYTAVV